eukprot:CAMPEP_0114971886 /NCGR_PEP_ID=MMETSP0216-20121206/91_1 /TAXON_ID=223996 /ORGANISM="Protocruzia adherens, Strain Boccale" /LENGTH=1061 /DNA_ID=CAMNT_0002332203 /DNA_START=40 /DNA_END=3222 /DNA_ORIENTATION=-
MSHRDVSDVSDSNASNQHSQIRIDLLCRIRPPLQSEIYLSQRLSRRSKSPNVSRDRSPVSTPRGAINPNFFYSFFTTVKDSKFAVASENPISGKLISSNLSTHRDLTACRSSILDDSARQEKIYMETCKDLAHHALTGQSSAVLLYGPTEGGKSYTLRGGEGRDRGLLSRFTEDLFNLLELSKQTSQRFNGFSLTVSVSVFQIYMSQVTDLLKPGGSSIRVRSQDSRCEFVGLSKETIKTAGDLSRCVYNALNNRKSDNLTKGDKQIKYKSHMVVRVNILKKPKGLSRMLSDTDDDSSPYTESHVDFVEFAGAEKTLLGSDATKEEKVFLSGGFSALSDYLVALAAGDGNIPSRGTYKENTLAKYLTQLFFSDLRSIKFFCNLSPSQQNFSEGLHSLNFASSIYEQCHQYKVSSSTRRQLRSVPSHGTLTRDFRDISCDNADVEYLATQIMVLKRQIEEAEFPTDVESSVFFSWMTEKENQLNSLLERFHALGIRGKELLRKRLPGQSLEFSVFYDQLETIRKRFVQEKRYSQQHSSRASSVPDEGSPVAERQTTTVDPTGSPSRKRLDENQKEIRENLKNLKKISTGLLTKHQDMQERYQNQLYDESLNQINQRPLTSRAHNTRTTVGPYDRGLNSAREARGSRGSGCGLPLATVSHQNGGGAGHFRFDDSVSTSPYRSGPIRDDHTYTEASPEPSLGSTWRKFNRVGSQFSFKNASGGEENDAQLRESREQLEKMNKKLSTLESRLEEEAKEREILVEKKKKKKSSRRGKLSSKGRSRRKRGSDSDSSEEDNDSSADSDDGDDDRRRTKHRSRKHSSRSSRQVYLEDQDGGYGEGPKWADDGGHSNQPSSSLGGTGRVTKRVTIEDPRMASFGQASSPLQNSGRFTTTAAMGHNVVPFTESPIKGEDQSKLEESQRIVEDMTKSHKELVKQHEQLADKYQRLYEKNQEMKEVLRETLEKNKKISSDLKVKSSKASELDNKEKELKRDYERLEGEIRKKNSELKQLREGDEPSRQKIELLERTLGECQERARQREDDGVVYKEKSEKLERAITDRDMENK